jgi:hypothetical protein
MLLADALTFASRCGCVCLCVEESEHVSGSSRTVTRQVSRSTLISSCCDYKIHVLAASRLPVATVDCRRRWHSSTSRSRTTRRHHVQQILAGRSQQSRPHVGLERRMSPQLLGQWLLMAMAMCARLLGSNADGCGFVRRVTLSRETCTSKYCWCSSCRSDVKPSEKESFAPDSETQQPTIFRDVALCVVNLYTGGA